MNANDLAKWHEKRSERAMNNLHCGSENWEYREAHRASDMHCEAARLIRELEAIAFLVASP